MPCAAKCNGPKPTVFSGIQCVTIETWKYQPQNATKTSSGVCLHAPILPHARASGWKNIFPLSSPGPPVPRPWTPSLRICPHSDVKQPADVLYVPTLGIGCNSPATHDPTPLVRCHVLPQSPLRNAQAQHDIAVFGQGIAVPLHCRHCGCLLLLMDRILSVLKHVCLAYPGASIFQKVKENAKGSQFIHDPALPTRSSTWTCISICHVSLQSIVQFL